MNLTTKHLTSRRKRVLYISYDDITEPLSESQVLPYLKGLSKEYDILLLVFNKKRMDYRTMASIGEINGLKAVYGLKYHKAPSLLATLWDIFCGISKSLSIIKRENISFVHARSHVACAIALGLKKITGKPYIFDARGLLADERADSGNWKKNSITYNIVKVCERALFKESERVIVLSYKGAGIIEDIFSVPKNEISVIPTCVDTGLFSPKNISRVNNGSLKFIYIGSLGTWYMLPEMLDFIEAAKGLKGNVKFLILTQTDEAYAKKLLSDRGTGGGYVEIKNAAHKDIPDYFNEYDASIFFIRPTFSKQFSCPTKFAEALSMGLPVVTNSGIGDLDYLIKKHSVGVVVDNFCRADYEKAVKDIVRLLADRKSLSERCRSLGLRELSLESGINKYHAIYEEMK